jgi:hypothetical protein
MLGTLPRKREREDGLESVKKTDQVAGVGMGTRFAARPFLRITGDTTPASVSQTRICH